VWRLLQYEKPVVKQAIEFGSKNEDTSLLCVAGFVIWKQGVNYIKNNASKTTLGISEDVVFEKDAKISCKEKESSGEVLSIVGFGTNWWKRFVSGNWNFLVT